MSPMMLLWFVAIISPTVVTSTSSVYERGSSSLPLPVPMATVLLESEVRCALTCSRNSICELYIYNESNGICDHFQVPTWPQGVVFLEHQGSLSLRGTVYPTVLFCYGYIIDLKWIRLIHLAGFFEVASLAAPVRARCHGCKIFGKIGWFVNKTI